MAKQKRVRCFGHGPLQLGPHYQVPWEDVWLRWVSKPGKTIHRLGPCLCSFGDAVGEVQGVELVLNHAPDLVERYGRDVYEEQLREAQQLVRRLEQERFVCEDSLTCDIPTIYTNAEYIDRPEAERMLAWWLKLAHGVTNPKFQWAKIARDFVINPFGGRLAEEETAL